MSFRRKHYPRKTDNYNMQQELLMSSGWQLDEQLNQLMDNVRDPFATYVEPSTYWDHTQAYEINVCLDSVVAGIAERLGYPTGLSFEDVITRL